VKEKNRKSCRQVSLRLRFAACNSKCCRISLQHRVLASRCLRAAVELINVVVADAELELVAAAS
jgi:hypothetical protein